MALTITSSVAQARGDDEQVQTIIGTLAWGRDRERDTFGETDQPALRDASRSPRSQQRDEKPPCNTTAQTRPRVQAAIDQHEFNAEDDARELPGTQRPVALEEFHAAKPADHEQHRQTHDQRISACIGGTSGNTSFTAI